MGFKIQVCISRGWHVWYCGLTDMYIMYVKLSNSDPEYFLPFLDVFGHKPWLDSLLRQAIFSSCRHKQPEGKKRCFWLADRNEPIQFGYLARISASQVSPTLAWISGFFCQVMFVTYYMALIPYVWRDCLIVNAQGQKQVISILYNRVIPCQLTTWVHPTF